MGRRQQSRAIVAGVAVASAVAGATAGCHPTGTPVVDPLYSAALAALVPLAASRARRNTWLWLAAFGTAFSRGFVLLPAIVGLGIAFASAFGRRRRQRVGALVGALAVQALLRWHPIGFQGLTAILAVVAVLPCLISAYRTLGRRARRRTRFTVAGLIVLAIILAVPAAIGALLARTPIQAAISHTEGALSSVSNGGTTAATANLSAASSELASAHHREGGVLTAGARLIPVVSQQRQAITRATASALTLTSAAKQEAAAVNVHDFAASNGQFNLAAIARTAQPLAELDNKVASASATLREVRSGWLVSPIATRLGTFQRQLDKAGNNLAIGRQAVAAAPSLLGGEGTRHYFLAFMTPSESRGLDGFIGSYGELTVANGKISLSRHGPIGELINTLVHHGGTLTGPADYLARYQGFNVSQDFQDVSYSPDFPTVAQVISQLYPQAGGEPIDGVFALDPYGLADLLKLTGPITMPGVSESLNSANAANFLLKQQYIAYPSQSARRDFLQDALPETFTDLTSRALPSPARLSAALDPAVRQGRLLFWTDHPADQSLLQRLHLTGAFPDRDGGDLLAVTTANSTNNKIDAYLGRGVNDRVTTDPLTGATQATITVTLRNTAPASGLPPYVLGNYAGSDLPYGTNRTWLTVYTPFTYQSATLNGSALPMSSLPELGVNALSSFVSIPPGGTETLTLHVGGQVKPGTAYTVAFRRQPGVLPEQDTVTVHNGSGAGATWSPGPAMTSEHAFGTRG